MGEVIEVLTPALVFRDALEAGLPVEEALVEVAEAFPQIPYTPPRSLAEFEPLIDARQQLLADERAEYEATSRLFTYGVAE